MNKLDSAFDIDPLFHKMSKTFDEGGAKGLLLVNLCVGDEGCNIVFDSQQENDEEQEVAVVVNTNTGMSDNDDVDNSKDGSEGAATDGGQIERNDGMIDISSLTTKLDSILGNQSIDNFSLVPQLMSLRDQHAELSKEGFVEEQVRSSRVSISFEFAFLVFGLSGLCCLIMFLIVDLSAMQVLKKRKMKPISLSIKKRLNEVVSHKVALGGPDFPLVLTIAMTMMTTTTVDQ